METAPSPIIAAIGLLAAALLAVVHLFAGYLRFLHVIPRSRWLSAASGVSVAYVFVHLLPELQRAQAALQAAVPPILAFLEHDVYLLALLGLVIFYGLESLALHSRRQTAGGEDRASTEVFWLHMASYGVYNALIGYLLLHREESGVRDLLLFAGAIGLHFVVNDYGLREHHKDLYTRWGRWILAAAVLVGWAIGLVVTVGEGFLAVLLAFLAGGIILNVLKEELPRERESRFGALLLGAAAYTVLLLAV